MGFPWIFLQLLLDVISFVLTSIYLVIDQYLTDYPVDVFAILICGASLLSLLSELLRWMHVLNINGWKLAVGCMTLMKMVLFICMVSMKPLAKNRHIWVKVLVELIFGQLLVYTVATGMLQLVQFVWNYSDQIDAAENVGAPNDIGLVSKMVDGCGEAARASRGLKRVGCCKDLEIIPEEFVKVDLVQENEEIFVVTNEVTRGKIVRLAYPLGPNEKMEDTL